MILGFSTGALAKGDFHAALTMLEPHPFNAIELSALRLSELDGLVRAIPTLDLRRYRVSLHAPSKFGPGEEQGVVDAVTRVADLVDGIVVHAEALIRPERWLSLGRKVLVENADARKHTGRTYAQMREILDELPDARVCLDLAHAHQVDVLQIETRRMAREFAGRIGQIHLSQIDFRGRHEALTRSVAMAFHRVAPMLKDIPVILESCVGPDEIAAQAKLARYVFSDPS